MTDATPLPRPLDHLVGARGYRRRRLPRSVDVRLDGNEGMLPAAALAEALHRAGPELLRRYPSAVELEERLARRLDVSTDEVLVLAGGDEILDRVFRAFVGSERTAIVPEPSFEMLPVYARIAACRTVTPLWETGQFPIEAVRDAIDADTGAIFVVTPNNPTGAVATFEDVERLSRDAPHALVVVDHAYVEFADEDLTREAARLPNVIVVRTLSKAYGLAGLRVGYAVGPAGVLDTLRAAGGPFSVAAPSLAIAAASLDDVTTIAAADRFVERVRTEREALGDRLSARGLTANPSQGNFVLARGRRAAWLAESLRGLGIAVRTWPGREHLDDAVRITCPGEPETFERVIDAIDVSLAPQALLFDLDGVLADVSASYRAAILATARHFGVELTAADIRGAKAAGGANNDWVVTMQLMGARGVEVPLDAVTERFELLYQGTAETAGLHTSERPTLTAAAWERFADRLPLGVVTGRPRRDAERFLGQYGLLARCSALVCMEDGPLKPDPWPVRRALEILGVRRAWFVGDTRDDLDAARTAGAVPIGCVAPGEDPDTARAHLLDHGAARVLDVVTDLEELL